MGMRFDKRRTKTGTTDDPDPNSVEPDTYFDIGYRRKDIRLVSIKGYLYYLIFKDSNGNEVDDGSATVTTWIRDDSDGTWIEAATDGAVGNRIAFASGSFLCNANIFLQLTDITGTNVASIQLRLEGV